MALTNTDLFVVERGGTNYKMAADQLTAKTGANGASLVPAGTIGERPTPVVGMVRFNTTNGFEEVYTGATLGWRRLDFVSDQASLPDVTLTGATSLDASYYCNNFTVAEGATLTSPAQGVIIRAAGNVVINASDWRLVGCQGAGSQANTTVLGSSGYGLGSGLAAINETGRPYSYVAQLGGSSGASGTFSADFVYQNSPGGDAGGYLVIVAQGTITLSGAVVMNCSGKPGGNAAFTAGAGGGGGSGGCIILSSANTLTTPASVTLNVSGGAGSNGIDIGNGTSCGAGGGGGGGWIILQSPNLVDSSVKNLAGGAGGSGGLLGLGGGGGASYAGAGGNGQFTVNAQSGQPGIFATGTYPI
jgi:hypothetical protein